MQNMCCVVHAWLLLARLEKDSGPHLWRNLHPFELIFKTIWPHYHPLHWTVLLQLEDQFGGRKPVDETLTDENIMNQAVGNDGTLPGGLSPDQFKGLVENPDVMTILQSSKMQEAMKLVMQGDQDELEKALKKDPELREMMQTLQSIIPTPDSEDSN